MKTLYLIDGYAQFFRAFHAIRTPMSSPVTKEPTNATFGFVGMVIKLLRECEPDYLAVALDVSGDREGLRNEWYPAYKANREEPPDGFREQVARCVAILEAMRVPVLGAERYEADDVIATVCAQLSVEPDLRVRLVSKDKDLQQLLAPGRVELYDVHTEAEITAESIEADLGITPSQVVDVLALMGDTVDNVPGVPGVGIKTAAKLIAEHGSMEAVVEEAAKEKGAIKGKRKENINGFAAELPLSKKLVTLMRDAPVEFELASAAIDAFDVGVLVPICKELGFNRYQEEVKGLLGARGEEVKEPEVRAPKAMDAFGGGLFEQAEGELGAEGARGETPRPARENVTNTLVRTRDELDELVAAIGSAEIIAFDTETTGTNATECLVCGLSFAVWDGDGPVAGASRSRGGVVDVRGSETLPPPTSAVRAWYVPVRAPEGEAHLGESEVLDALRGVLEAESPSKTGHNLKFDMLVMRNAPVISGHNAIHLGGVVFDTMVADYLVDASRSSHRLDHLALALLGHTCTPISELIGTGKHQRTFDTVPLDRASDYACEDAEVSLRLHAVLSTQIDEMGLRPLFDDVELPLVEVLAELEHNGIVVEPDELDRQAARLNERILDLKEEIASAAPREFSPDSPKQLAEILFGPPDGSPSGLGIKPLKKTKTGYSTDQETLEKLAGDPEVTSPIPSLIVEYRQLTKLVSTYLEALKDAISARDGRIHCSFNQTVAATGRLSSSDPNLQNIPIRTEVGRQIRRAFVAPPGRVLISADYSQIELRLLAHLSADEALIEAFRAGADIHRAVAAQIHSVDESDVSREQREGAKMVNFGIVYGITPFGLARRLGVGKGEAAEIIDGYKARFARITEFLDACAHQAQTNGYVETMLGRRRPIDGIDSKNAQRRALAERMAINSVVQGSAADLIKLAMVQVHREIGEARARTEGVLSETLMLLQIHDELVFEAEESSADEVGDLVVRRMESAMELSVPLVVESASGRSWFEGK